MLTDDEMKQVMLEAIAEFGGDDSMVTEESWRHIASKLRAEMRQRGAGNSDYEIMARKLIDEFVLVPGASTEAVADATGAISDGFGFEARFEREPQGKLKIALTPKPMH
jgi:hypothetical protein